MKNSGKATRQGYDLGVHALTSVVIAKMWDSVNKYPPL